MALPRILHPTTRHNHLHSHQHILTTEEREQTTRIELFAQDERKVGSVLVSSIQSGFGHSYCVRLHVSCQSTAAHYRGILANGWRLDSGKFAVVLSSDLFNKRNRFLEQNRHIARRPRLPHRSKPLIPHLPLHTYHIHPTRILPTGAGLHRYHLHHIITISNLHLPHSVIQS